MTGSATKQSSQCRRTFRSPGQPHRPTGLLRLRLAMTTKERRKRNADRRVDRTSALFRARRASSGTRRLSAFHRGSCGSDRTPPLSSGLALPGTRDCLCPSPASSSQTGHSAGRAYCPKPPGNGLYRSARGNRTRSTFRSTLGRRRPSLSEIRPIQYLKRGRMSIKRRLRVNVPNAAAHPFDGGALSRR